jgi:hypothetical protein
MVAFEMRPYESRKALAALARPAVKVNDGSAGRATCYSVPEADAIYDGLMLASRKVRVRTLGLWSRGGCCTHREQKSRNDELDHFQRTSTL